jgi:hypothetical protein
MHGRDARRLSEDALQAQRAPADTPVMETERVHGKLPESPASVLLGALGFIAFFLGGIALIAVMVTLVFHPGSEGSTQNGPAQVAFAILTANARTTSSAGALMAR